MKTPRSTVGGLDGLGGVEGDQRDLPSDSMSSTSASTIVAVMCSSGMKSMGGMRRPVVDFERSASRRSKILKLPVASIELGPADLFSHLSSLMNAMAFWMSPRPTQRTPHQKPIRCDEPQRQDLDGVENDIREGGALDEVEDSQVS